MRIIVRALIPRSEPDVAEGYLLYVLRCIPPMHACLREFLCAF